MFEECEWSVGSVPSWCVGVGGSVGNGVVEVAGMSAGVNVVVEGEAVGGTLALKPLHIFHPSDQRLVAPEGMNDLSFCY